MSVIFEGKLLTSAEDTISNSPYSEQTGEGRFCTNALANRSYLYASRKISSNFKRSYITKKEEDVSKENTIFPPLVSLSILSNT